MNQMADLLRDSFPVVARAQPGSPKKPHAGNKVKDKIQDQSDDLAFWLFSEEDEPLLLSEEALLSDEPDDAVSVEEPLAPLLADSPLGLLADFSLDGSPDLPLPE